MTVLLLPVCCANGLLSACCALPVAGLVRLQGTVPWDPHTLERAMGGSSSSGRSNRGDKDLQVLDCADFSTVTVTHRTFFSG